jgi:hypothetical protein
MLKYLFDLKMLFIFVARFYDEIVEFSTTAR